MKKLLLFCILLSLSGCALVQRAISWKVSPFDGAEYSMATHLTATIAEDAGKCSDSVEMKSAALDINHQAFELYLYASGIKGDADTTQMLMELQQMTGELQKRYSSVDKVSGFYCTDKMEILLRSAGTIQKAIGAKPK
jgi:hypothetical protein